MKRIFCIATLALLGAGSTASGQVEIGVSEWISPTAWGTVPGADRQQIQQFAGVVEDERIETDVRGAADFVFENGSRFLVGPDCEVVLDETFYDPALDHVARMDVYADTVCVVRAGAGGETLIFVTPVATVTISEASASLVYSGADADAGASATLHLAASPGTLPSGVDLAVFFEAGLAPEGKGVVEIRDENGETAILRRPGFMVVHATPGGLGEPERTDPVLLGRAMSRVTGIGLASAPMRPGLATAPSPVEVYTVLEGPERPGVTFEPCAVSDFCDAETVVLNPIYSSILSGAGVTWPFP